MPVCKKCLEEKPDSLFVLIKGQRVGLTCRQCRSAQIKAARANASQIEARKIEKAEIQSQGACKCSKCGEVKVDNLFPQTSGKRHGSVCSSCTAELKKIWRSRSEKGQQTAQRTEKRAAQRAQREAEKAKKATARAESLLPESFTECAQCGVRKQNTEFVILGGKRHGKRCNECATKATKQHRAKRMAEALDAHRAARSHEAMLRRAGLAKRIPSWANKDEIAKVYAARPEGHHVDHVIPLFGKKVSGLHVEANLQYLPAAENLKKNRKYDPME